MQYVIYGLIYLGSALMVYNIWGFIRFARQMKARDVWKKANTLLYVPIVLLTLFLAGYLAVGIFGKPDIIVSGILSGGSVFVFVMYLLLVRITRQIMESEQLEARLMAAKESSRAKAAFLSGVSHEMRTPLNVIIGLGTLTLSDPALPAGARERTEKTNRSAEQLLGMVNNILDLNSIETGEFITKNDPFSLRDVIGQVSEAVRAACGEKGLTYDCEMGDDVCDVVIGDDLRVRQVLFNLLDNAVKYTPAPGTVSLRVRAEKTDGDVRNFVFTVTDTGVGMEPAFLARVFDPFSKEDTSTTSNYGGSGLGLAVTRNIVERLGGGITAESEKNVGSTFTVTIPLRPAPAAETEAGTGTEVSLKGKRILIAEDIPENAEIVADLLELEGAGSERAENGQIAVDMFTAAEPGYYDAILMDLRMPVMDGITATRRIRASGKPDAATVPIVALTANAFESDVKKSLDAGMNAHLSKPADTEKLYATLKKYIGAAKAPQGDA